MAAIETSILETQSEPVQHRAVNLHIRPDRLELVPRLVTTCETSVTICIYVKDGTTKVMLE